MSTGSDPVLVTGWTGNTGSFVVRQIRDKFPHRQIVGLARSATGAEDVLAEQADLSDAAAVEAVFQRHRFGVVVHVANIRFTPLVMRLATAHGVPQVILVHTTGIYSRYRAYSALYRDIESAVLEDPGRTTRWTILRPTMIYGNHRDYNMHKLIRFLARYPVFPIFGDGRSVLQPVHVEDLATAIVSCVDNPQVACRSYDLSGGSVITYREVLDTITRLLNKRVRYVHVPYRLAVGLAAVYARLVREPRFTVEQVQRLQEDKSYGHEAAQRDLGYHPRSFEEGIRDEIRQMRRQGLIPPSGMAAGAAAEQGGGAPARRRSR